ncbi:MAG: hypothetical protein GVY33_12295 [Alphaproteobacteria bacterium]|jgi:hypothetical protein|nr:hypothetical protein [Alphaproteobacteria bacterium]
MSVLRTRCVIPLLAAITLAGPVFAADSMTIRNCTQTDVRVFFYNNNDAAMIIAKSNIDIDAGTDGALSVAGNGPSKARVFQRAILDKPVMIQSNLDHNSTYFLTARGGEWRLSVSSEDCSMEFLNQS